MGHPWPARGSVGGSTGTHGPGPESKHQGHPRHPASTATAVMAGSRGGGSGWCGLGVGLGGASVTRPRSVRGSAGRCGSPLRCSRSSCPRQGRFPFCGKGFGGGEPGVGGHGEGDVGVPGPPVADLVVVEAGFLLGPLEAFLDGPAAAGDAGQVDEAGAAGSAADVVGDLAGGDAGSGEEPVPAAGPSADADRHAGHRYSRGPCAPGPLDSRQKRLRGQGGNQLVGAAGAHRGGDHVVVARVAST